MDKTPLCTLTCNKRQLQLLRIALASGLMPAIYQVVRSGETSENKTRKLHGLTLNFHTTETLLEWKATDSDKAIRTVTKTGLEALRTLLANMDVTKLFQAHEHTNVGLLKGEVLSAIDLALTTATDPLLGMFMPVREMPKA